MDLTIGNKKFRKVLKHHSNALTPFWIEGNRYPIVCIHKLPLNWLFTKRTTAKTKGNERSAYLTTLNNLKKEHNELKERHEKVKKKLDSINAVLADPERFKVTVLIEKIS